MFLDEVVKSKIENESAERMKCTIAHAIISACRPRSFVSILLISISTYIHRKHGSRELIDIGSAESYQEVELLINNILCTKSSTDYISELDAFVQYIFNNADFNPRSESVNDSWHIVGGLAAMTHESSIPTTTVIPRINDPLSLHEKKIIQIVEIPPKEVDNALHDIIIKRIPDSSMSSAMHTLDTVNKGWPAMHHTNFEVKYILQL